MSIIGAQAERPGLWNRLFGSGPSATTAAASAETQITGKKSWFLGGLALAGIGGILANQAEQVTKFGALRDPYNGFNEEQQTLGHYHNGLTLISRIIEVLGVPLKTARLVVKDLARPSTTSEATPNITKIADFIEKIPFVNIKKFLGPKIKWLNYLLDHRVAGSLGSFIFANENMLSSFFIERPPGDKSKVESWWTAFFPPLSKFTSFLGSLLSPLGHASAMAFRFGKTGSSSKDYKAANLIARLGDIFLPAASNLNAFFKHLMANKLSRTTGMDIKEARRHYGINLLHVLQGAMGSLLAVPSLFGSFSRFKMMFNETSHKDENGKEVNNQEMIQYFFATLTKRIQNVIQPVLNTAGKALRIKPLQELSFDKTVEQTQVTINNFINRGKQGVIAAAESICNLPIVSDLCKTFLPYDATTKRIIIDPSSDPNAEDILKDPKNKLFGFINKSTLMQTFDHLTRPIQSILMLLPTAWPALTDPEIQTQGGAIVRTVDRLLGLSSVVLGLPSFLVYTCSMRIPKLIAWYFGQKQKHAISKSDHGYNAFEQLQALQERLLNSNWLPFARFVGQSLNRVINNEFGGASVFVNEDSHHALLEQLEKESQSQERHVKTLSSVTMARRFLKTLLVHPLTNRIFKANVVTGELSSKEATKAKIHGGIQMVEQAIKTLIPGLGYFLALPVTAIKKMFEVRTPGGVNMPSMPNPAMMRGQATMPQVPGMMPAMAH